ncbi:hypothetical protein UFOVP301_32 [uncultured Caudovirales phage]|uniref:Uncharacterized protein n=1 Tax=uncultured Caudovirales phage TaxID=2100421 RepID=A0A6J5S0F4_9CAUD|nr:hypothetical protein UFOVP301_32 [uncultured Caudovirales phage]CAB4150847.1 hypothetical protein UFOVP576_39 [uncultured Caudovirales phage]CAB4199578.1 hypothetical protein UFOVP1350_5 [uncultured Caudovirales phage]
MSMENILCLLCGSLVATAIFTVFVWRQGIIEDRLINHIRRSAYNKGWQDCQDKKFETE